MPPTTGSVKKSVSIKEHVAEIFTPSVQNITPPKTEIPNHETIEDKAIADVPSEEKNVILQNEKIETTATIISEEPVQEPVNQEYPIHENDSEISGNIPSPNLKNDTADEVTNDQTDEEHFLHHWQKVVEFNFEKQPIVYFSLKKTVPQMVDNVIYIKVKNELQKDEIEEKKRAMIAYFRNHYKNEIENIEILVDEEMESKIVVLDEREKLKLLHEQNNSLSDFMKILNMNLKE